MRYYSLLISDSTGRSIVPDGDQGFTRGTGPTFSSLYKDQFTGRLTPDPGALQIEFDIPVTQLAKPQGAFRVKISGVGLKMISQSSNLTGMRFQLKAGMSPGLPLVNPAQAGVIAEGNVYQGYGNWQGTAQTLDLIVNPGPPGTSTSIYNRPISFHWPAGTSLHDAIDAALQAALPEFRRQIFIDPRLTLTNDEAGYYAAPNQWADYLLGLTQTLGSQLLGFSYPGVQIVATGDTVYVFDGTQQGSPTTTLNFEDLIGQPTWMATNNGQRIAFQTVLRADIGVGNRIRFPVTANGAPIIALPYALTTPGVAVPNTPARSSTTFQGEFVVTEVHHFGSYRDSDADAWTTAFTAVPAPPASSS